MVTLATILRSTRRSLRNHPGARLVELVKTITLSPGETRKDSKRQSPTTSVPGLKSQPTSPGRKKPADTADSMPQTYMLSSDCIPGECSHCSSEQYPRAMRHKS